MPELQTNFLQPDTNRNYSASVWKGCKLDAFRDGIGPGNSAVIVEDDFDSTYPTASRYKLSGTSATIALDGTAVGGELKLACTGSANGEAYLANGIGVGSWSQILSASVDEVWWETRVKVSDITNGVYATGLSKPGDVAAAMLADTTLVFATTVSALGFRTLVGTPSRLDVFYMDDATATVYVTGVATLVAGTYVKLGIRFGGTADGNLIRFYVNGTEVANTAGTMGVLATATNFPDSIPLTDFWACKSNASAALTMTIDRYRGVMRINDATYG